MEGNGFAKVVYDKLVAKVSAIETRAFVLKTRYGTDKLGIKNKIYESHKKISDTSELLQDLL